MKSEDAIAIAKEMKSSGFDLQQELFDLLNHEIAIELLAENCPEATLSEVEWVLSHKIVKENCGNAVPLYLMLKAGLVHAEL